MSSFVDSLGDVFEYFGPVQARKMFGGYGIYHRGLMFALVADDVLYLKVDAENAGDFIARNLSPFEYTKQGRILSLSYHQAPEELFDDREFAAQWARRSYEAARRAVNKKKKSKKKQNQPAGRRR